MKNKIAFITALFLLLTLMLPFAVQAAGPVITLVNPVPPTAQFTGGEENTISLSATATESNITSAAFQVLFNDPVGTFPALRIFAQKPITPGTASAGAAARTDTTAAPAGLPASSVVSMVILGTVSSVNPASGEWQIGTPPVFVYEGGDNSTSVQGTPVVGSEVRVSAIRTLTSAPIIAETITVLGTGTLPASSPTVERSFLFNGTIQSVQTGTQMAGMKLGGTTWDISGVPFRIDDANFPAVTDPGIGLGTGLNSLVTVRFTEQLPVTSNANVALEVFSPQIPTPVSGVLHPDPVISTEPVPVNLPAGSWKLVIIEGVVSAKNPNGEWAIGNPPVFVYQSTNTTIQGAPTVGSEVRVNAARTLASGPLVAREIILLSTSSRIPGPASMSSSFLFNGTVGTMGAAGWSIGGANFVVNDPSSPAVLQSGLDVGSAVTVEYKFMGAPAPDAALWVPLQLNATTNLWTATVTPPTGTTRTGFLFLRATDTQQLVAAAVVPASLVVPPPDDGGGGGGEGGNVSIIPIALSGFASTGGLNVDSSGITTSEAKVATADGGAMLTLAQGTKLLTKDGTPLTTLTVAPSAGAIPSPPSNNAVVLSYDFGPDGATFDPPLSLTLAYGLATLPASVEEGTLVIAFWDGISWVKLDSTVDTATRTVTAQISHFTIVGLLAELPAPTPTPVVPPEAAPVPTAPPAPAIIPAPLPTEAPAPAPVSVPAPGAAPSSDINSGVIIGAAGSAVVLIGLALLYVRRRRND